MLTLLQSETNTLNMCNESIERCTLIAENTSGDFTNAAFLDEPQSVCLKWDLFSFSFQFLITFQIFNNIPNFLN